MKRLALFIALTLSLSACGTVQQAQLKSAVIEAKADIANQCFILAQMSPKEVSSWQRTAKEIEPCTKGIPEPWPKNKVMDASNCIEAAMKTHILPVSYSRKSFQTYLTERKAEHQAYADGKIDWSTLEQKGKDRQDRYFSSSPTGSYFNYANCHNNILSTKVFPAYPNQLKPLLTEYMTNLLAYARAADKKKLAKEDFAVGEQKLYSEFTIKEQQVIAGYQAQNAQSWANSSRQMQQLSQQVMRAEKASMPKTTNCHTVGNSVNCTSW